ncbi:unnamed protein product [Agarophyton chilense]
MHDAAPEASHPSADGNNAISTPEDMKNIPDEHPANFSDIIFQCANCHIVVGDTRSPHVVDLDNNILSLGAASNIKSEDKLHICQNGFATGCTFRRLLCDSCNTPVGRTYTSTTAALDQYRSLYTFDYDSLDTYRLGSGKTPEGETLDNLKTHETKREPDDEEPRVSAEDFIALDTYVTDVGKAVNKQTDAMDQYGKALEEIQKDFKDSDNLVKDIRQSLEYVQNIILVWEERLRNLDSFKEKTNKLLEIPKSCTKRCQTMELEFTNLGPKLDRLKDTLTRLDHMEREITDLSAKVDGLAGTGTRFNDIKAVWTPALGEVFTES